MMQGKYCHFFFVCTSLLQVGDLSCPQHLENWEATCCEASFAHFARIAVEVGVAVASCLKGHFWREWAQDGADWFAAVASCSNV
jgi:hypothetical protein